MRTDSPFELSSVNHTDVQRYAVLGRKETLLVATIPPATLISLSSYPDPNVTVKSLQVD